MLPSFTPGTTVTELVGMIVASVIMIAFVLQKFLTSWKLDKAESSVLTLMHNELERMSKENTKLSLELSKLHSELLRLNKELNMLTQENQRLHNEIVSLTSEVSRLQNVINSYKGVQSGPTS